VPIVRPRLQVRVVIASSRDTPHPPREHSWTSSPNKPSPEDRGIEADETTPDRGSRYSKPPLNSASLTDASGT
jgi:hypothetical protein